MMMQLSKREERILKRGAPFSRKSLSLSFFRKRVAEEENLSFSRLFPCVCDPVLVILRFLV